jgi:hypothetical protein
MASSKMSNEEARYAEMVYVPWLVSAAFARGRRNQSLQPRHSPCLTPSPPLPSTTLTVYTIDAHAHDAGRMVRWDA